MSSPTRERAIGNPSVKVYCLDSRFLFAGMTLLDADIFAFEVIVVGRRLVHLNETDARGRADGKGGEPEIEAVIAHHILGIFTRWANAALRIARIGRHAVDGLAGRATSAG